MTGQQNPAVTVIGLGLMGSALAGAFVKAGCRTTVWNRSPGKAGPLIALGATSTATVTEAISASTLVVVCVSTYDDVREILDPVADALAGRVVVNLTSGTSTQAREMADWAARAGIGYLDGAIMSIPQGIGAPDAVLLYSGSSEAYAAHGSTLAVLGGGGGHLGADAGLASLYDVALLGVMWGVLNSFLQGAALVAAAGVKATTFAEAASTWIGGVTGFATAYAAKIDAGDYTAEDATLTTHVATMDHLIEESRAHGVPADLPTFVRALAQRGIEAGHGSDSYASMIEVFRSA